MKTLIFVLLMICAVMGKNPSAPNGTTTEEPNSTPINEMNQTMLALKAIQKFAELVKSSSKEPSKFNNIVEHGFVFEKCLTSENATWIDVFNTTDVVLEVKGLWISDKVVRVNLQATREKSKVRDIVFDINSKTGKLIGGYIEGCQKRRWGSFISTPFLPISIFGPFNPLNFYKEVNKKGFEAFRWIGSVLAKS
ncbi:hypothetical protein B9Z55_026331 [Caenorhabditis nigoni]|uniref:Uncharacterized protein n=1 Tax=Caenorhabditis nigoni TaxID=1611254 RepID=A0A2G5T2A4_9PELO|nr:hypothetical protein B9Z55_026331 [Caenorhabditis nigoni]